MLYRQKPRDQSVVFLHPRSGHFVAVELVSMLGTLFFLKAKTADDAERLCECLLVSPSVTGVSLYIGGKFKGASDGAGS